MNVFEAVKQSVTTRQAAEHYGIRVNRNGMCVCPFHNDKNPSMKIDRRYHCFGCQADGDVIDFVSRLHGTGTKEAALMLAQDFSVPYEDKAPTGRSRPDRKRRRKRRSSDLSAWNAIASGYCPTTIIFCAAGKRTMPHRRQRKHGTRCLRKPCKTKQRQNTYWTSCCSPKWRNGLPSSWNTERK